MDFFFSRIFFSSVCIGLILLPVLPVINEDQAREALLQYVAQNCCYGSGAAKNMTFRDLKSSSAFHVCMPCFICEIKVTFLYIRAKAKTFFSLIFVAVQCKQM